MKSTKNLSDDYQLVKLLDLSQSKAIISLNLGAIPLLVIFGWFFSSLSNIMRGTSWGVIHFNISLNTLWNLLLLMMAVILIILLHELIHGIFYWIFTHEFPVFAFKGAYAYAAAPDWYIPRKQFVIICSSQQKVEISVMIRS